MVQQPGQWAAALGDFKWSLPSCPHIPGKNAQPDIHDDIHRVARHAPDPTDPAKWRRNEAWLAGLWLFEHEFFWEAHLVWDPVWMNCRPRSPERNLVYGLIHLALAQIKLRMQRPQAAWRLARMARIYCREALDDAGPELMGLDLDTLVGSIENFLLKMKNERAPGSRRLQ